MPLTTDERARLRELVALYLRPVSELGRKPDGSIAFDPPLTVGEESILARLVTIAQQPDVPLTAAQWQALDDQVATLREFRTKTDADFAAMTAAQRDTALIGAMRAVIDVLRAVDALRILL